MAHTKTEFKWFTIFQHEAEEEYLRYMHFSGWKLTGISFPGFYHFEECAPEDMVYQLDYNQNGTAHKREYVQIFADCGWEYMFDFVGYSYFRKPVSQMEGTEEIFCDDESRLEMMKRVFRGRVLFVIILFVCAFAVSGILKLWKPADSRYSLNTLPDQYSIGAEYLNESIQHEMELKAGDELEVSLQVLKGNIHLIIRPDEKEPVYEGTVSELTHFTLPIHKNGTYTIITTGKEAEGSFSFQIK